MAETDRRSTRALPLSFEGVLADWRTGRGSLQQRLAWAVRKGIERGDLPAGTVLAPERSLAAHLEVSRNTVAAAYDMLRREGFVERRQGRGTIVRSDLALQAVARAAGLSTSLRLDVALRGLTESPSGATEFLGAHIPESGFVREVLGEALASIDLGQLMGQHGYYPVGYPPLRRSVAARFDSLGLPTHEEEILITSGAQQAISLVAACYAGPGRSVIVEDPTFPGAIDAFLVVGSRIFTVPVREAGIDVPILESTLRGSDVSLVYLMPSFHNPTGALMPEGARRQVAALAATAEVPVVEDDALAELPVSGDPLPPIASFSRKGPLLSIGSMSKLFWGGLRVGWIRGPRPMIGQLGRLKAAADFGTSTLSQAVAHELLGRTDEVRQVRQQELRECLSSLTGSLEQHLPDWKWRLPAGGLSLWVQLPVGNSRDFARHAAREGAAIVPGSVMSARSAFDDYIRLPLNLGGERLTDGIARLSRAWSTYRRELAREERRLDVVV